MGAELVIPDQSCQLCFESSLPKRFNPDGSVDKDHGSSIRRLRTSLMFGAVPARARSLRPASLAMIDFRASRSSSALSVIPVYSCAVFSRSSSSVTDALIASPLTPIIAPDCTIFWCFRADRTDCVRSSSIAKSAVHSILNLPQASHLLEMTNLLSNGSGRRPIRNPKVTARRSYRTRSYEYK